MTGRDDYVDVATRIQTFKELYPDGSLSGRWDWTPMGDQLWLTYRAEAHRTPDDPRPGVGHAWEPVPGRTAFTRGSELMNAETSAWGRALAALGIAVHKGIASRQEVTGAESRRAERLPATPTDDPWYDQPGPARDPAGLPHGPRGAATQQQRRLIWHLLDEAGITDPDKQREAVAQLADPPLAPGAKLSKRQASAVIEALKTPIAVADLADVLGPTPVDEAASE